MLFPRISQQMHFFFFLLMLTIHQAYQGHKPASEHQLKRNYIQGAERLEVLLSMEKKERIKEKQKEVEALRKDMMKSPYFKLKEKVRKGIIRISYC